MKKIIPISIVVALVLSGIGAIAIEADDNTRQDITSFYVSDPMFSTSGNYIAVNLEEQTSVTMEENKPMTPVITKVFAFNQGTEIKDVQVNYDVKEYQLSEKICPAPAPVALIDNNANVKKDIIADKETYESSKLYPADSYSVKYAFGMYQGERSVMVIVKINSQYNSAEDILTVPSGDIEVSIIYDEPAKQPASADSYDMLIITPAEFVTNLQPLVDHKAAMGITTIVETLEDIYETYDGRNDPEDIKLCIKNAIEEYEIDFVLLAGGRYKQTTGWWLPEFRNNNDDGWESGYSVDLYYADVYKNMGADFEDWDSNENEIFGEWRPVVPLSKDIMDFYPDVTLSRIPFHYEFELNIVVNKIIAYETGTDDSWFKKAVMIAGDTFPAPDNYFEGEIETTHTGDLLEADGFTVEKLFTSLETLTGVPDVVSAISAGAGFVHFAGHGNPSTWSNHPPHDADTWITGLSVTDMHKLRNREKLPFIMVGGCHNAQFNATMGYIMEGIKELGIAGYFSSEGPDFGPFWLKEWVPRDFCSWLLLRKNGGAIGSVGHTGLGYGYVGEGSSSGLGGWIEPRMFDAYTNQDIDILGSIHDQAIVDYINIIGMINDDQIDRKTIETFTLLGDPSLMLGGYD